MDEIPKVTFALILIGLATMAFGLSISGHTSGPSYIYGIYPYSIPSGTQGVFYSVSFAALPPNPNYIWKVSGQPPKLLGRNSNTALIVSGIPTRAGHYTMYVTVSNGVESATAPYSLNILVPISPGATTPTQGAAQQTTKALSTSSQVPCSYYSLSCFSSLIQSIFK